MVFVCGCQLLSVAERPTECLIQAWSSQASALREGNKGSCRDQELRLKGDGKARDSNVLTNSGVKGWW